MNRPHDTAEGPCGCSACYKSHGSNPARPWVLKAIKVCAHRPGHLAYHGVNLYSAPGEYGREFVWYMGAPAMSRPEDSRYEAGGAAIEDAALQMFERWNVSQEVRWPERGVV